MIPKSLLIFVAVGVVSGFTFGSFLLDFKTSSQLVFVEGPGLSILTDKTDFKRGEEIRIRLINSGTVPLTFTDSSYGIKITGLSGILIFSPPSENNHVQLEPKQEVEIIWNQIKSDGDAALEGLYKISAIGFDSKGHSVEKSITINIWK